MTLWKTLHDYVILCRSLFLYSEWFIVPYYTECNLSLLVLIFWDRTYFTSLILWRQQIWCNSIHSRSQTVQRAERSTARLPRHHIRSLCDWGHLQNPSCSVSHQNSKSHNAKQVKSAGQFVWQHSHAVFTGHMLSAVMLGGILSLAPFVSTCFNFMLDSHQNTLTQKPADVHHFSPTCLLTLTKTSSLFLCFETIMCVRARETSEVLKMHIN